MKAQWVPNTKVMAGSLGGTIAGLIIDVLEGRFQLVLATGELNAIVIFSGLAVAYFMPERNANEKATISTAPDPGDGVL